MAERRVTVIIPTNRGGAYLDAAVASVRSQTRPAHEILLVDDGSPEPGLADVAARLGLRYLRQDASGLSVARNTGVAGAEGEWIAFLDDDDVWHPERLDEQLRALDTEGDVVAVSTGGWYMDAEGVPFGTGWGAPPATSAQFIAYEAVPPRITTLLIRRSEYLAVGGCRRAMEPAEDNDLIQRLLQRGEFASVDRQLVGYRRHTGNITQRSLAGREASRIVIDDLLRDARHRQDGEVVALLKRQRRTARRISASGNTGELIAALRAGESGYAFQLAMWGLRHVPFHSVAAVARRWRSREASGR